MAAINLAGSTKQERALKKTPPYPAGKPQSQAVGAAKLLAPTADEHARVRYAQGNWIGLEGHREAQNWGFDASGEAAATAWLASGKEGGSLKLEA